MNFQLKPKNETTELRHKCGTKKCNKKYSVLWLIFCFLLRALAARSLVLRSSSNPSRITRRTRMRENRRLACFACFSSASFLRRTNFPLARSLFILLAFSRLRSSCPSFSRTPPASPLFPLSLPPVILRSTSWKRGHKCRQGRRLFFT